MEYNTSALCDIYLDQVDVVEPMFSNFGGVTFLPEDYLYADNTGIIISQEPLSADLGEEEEDELL